MHWFVEVQFTTLLDSKKKCENDQLNFFGSENNIVQALVKAGQSTLIQKRASTTSRHQSKIYKLL